MSHPPRICLVSGSHLCTNPRLVKEADALQMAGYPVHVIAGRNYPFNDPFDAAILKAAQWDCTIVDYQTGWRSWMQRLTRKLARMALRLTSRPPLWLAARAQHSAIYQIARDAACIPADLYIGHTLVGLAAAAKAARQNNAKLGFDAEDFHSWETTEAVNDIAEQRAIFKLESTLLPRCAHLTAAAPLIAEAYVARYGIKRPLTVQNTFSLREAPEKPPTDIAIRNPVRFYWFSQTIGHGRGIEEFLAVLGQMQTPATLSLRGKTLQPSYVKSLQETAHAHGFKGELKILAAAPASEMARQAAEHDIGLALEPLEPPNRDICLPNKIYTYLLAGLPTVCTATRAQTTLAKQLGNAAQIINLETPCETARQLDLWLSQPDNYRRARHAAWNLGQTRYNWEKESKILISAISAAIKS